MKTSLKSLLGLAFLACLTLNAQDDLPLFNALDTIKKAQQLYESGKYDTAARMYGKIPQGDTLYSLALLEKSRSHFMKMDYQTCVETAQKGLRLQKGYYSSFLNLMASAYSSDSQAVKAYEIYDRAIAKYPSDYQLYYSRGATYHENDELEKALRDYKKTIELNPFHYYAHVRSASLALNEERYAESLMSLGYAYIVAESEDNVLSLTVGYDKALSGDMELESGGLEIETENSFKRVNLLLKSRAALRDDYELSTDLSFPLVRQMHLTYSQVNQSKINPNDFWSHYYQPFYQALMEEELFEEFTFLLIKGSDQDYHQKLLRKNSKDIKELYQWAAQQIIKNNAVHREGYKPDGQWIRYFYHESSEKLSGIAELNAKKEVEGKYVGFYLNGSKGSEGMYNAEAEREGTWVFYHESGDTSRVTTYENGSPKGATAEWHDNGHLFIESTFNENGKMHGSTNIYDRHGLLSRKLMLQDGVIADTTYNYYPSGQLASKIPMQEGKAQGKATFYHENGKLSSKIQFRNDERHGEAIFYHPNGAVDAKVKYRDGKQDGAYVSYYPNEQLASEGQYLEGVKSGLWKNYEVTGILSSEETFDDKGKKTGRSTEYDIMGRKTSSFLYKKGEIESYKIFDLHGAVRAEDKQKRGAFLLKYYNLYGNITSEGRYAGDHKEGKWKYYTQYGVLKSEENYDDEGNLTGATKNYFLGGNLKSLYHYKNGQLQGYYVEYFRNGNKKEEGWYEEGKQTGPFYQYFSNGLLYTKAYYVNDKLNGSRQNYDLNGDYTFVEQFDKGVLVQINDYQSGERYKATEIGSKDAVKRFYPNGKLLLSTKKYGPTFHGESIRYYGNGQVEHQGNYANGLRQGEWSYYYPNGQLNYQGSYLLGQPTGVWKYFHPNGIQKETRSFLSGEIHGENPTYDDHGELSGVENYHVGENHGKRYFYLLDGIENHIRVYDQGRITGYIKETGEDADSTFIPVQNGTAEVKSYYSNGQLARTYILEKGVFQGSYEAYYPDGTPAIKGVLLDDERDGEYVYYYPNGQVKEKIMYKTGMREGITTTYYANGKKKAETTYQAGKKNGEKIYYNKNGKEKFRYIYVNDKIYEKL